MAGHYGSLVFLRLQAELDRLFKEALETDEDHLQDAASQPAVDVIDTGKSIVILIESPGSGVADLELEVRGSTMRISGKRSALVPPGGHYLRLERSQGRFSRELQLLWPLNTHAATATLVDGLITIEFPKIADQRHAPRRIAISEAAEPATDLRRNKP